MSYGDFENSVQDGQPVEFYEFLLGDIQYNYTSAEDTIVIGATEYTPVAISRSRYALGSERRQEIMTVTMPSSIAPATKYISIVPGQLCTLTIKRRHRGDSELVVLFKGIVRSVGYSDDGYKADLAVAPLTYALSRDVPRDTYQSLCNRVLYDAKCGVSQSSFDHTGEVLVVDGNTLTVDGLDGQPDGYWTGGFVQYGTNDWRMVLSHTGNDIVLLMPFPANVDGKNVTVFAGCDHTLATCKSKFNNVANFGGFAFVPTRDIFKSGV